EDQIQPAPSRLMHPPPDDRENAHHSAYDDVIPDALWRGNPKHKRRDDHPDAQHDVNPTIPTCAPLRHANTLLVRVYFPLYVRVYFLYPFLHNLHPLVLSVSANHSDVCPGVNFDLESIAGVSKIKFAPEFRAEA